MASSKTPQPWFRVGVPLSEKRSAFLMVCSFLLPILIYTFVAYCPWFWGHAYKLTVAGSPDDKVEFGATYTQGSVMKDDEFERFQESIRNDNRKLAAKYEAGETDFGMSGRAARSLNKRLLREFEPVLSRNQLFDVTTKNEDNIKEYYKALYSAAYDQWKAIANETSSLKKNTLSDENREIIKKNWALLSSVSPNYDSKNLYSKPIYKLVPQGDKQVARQSWFPAPHEMLQRGWEDITGNSELGELSLVKRYGQSLRIVFIGFFVACVIGLPLALLAGTFSFFSRLIEPFTDFFRYMPAPAFSTLLVVVFNIYEKPKIALVVVGTLPHLILMVANTTRMVDRPLLDAAQTLGAKRGRLITKVIVPGILPHLYNDLRILLGWAWTWLVIAELIGAKSGLTEIIDTQGRRFNFDHVYPVILLIGITGFVTDQILASLRPIFFPYTSTGKKGVFATLFSVLLKPFTRKKATS